jgi:hypothetical protein
VNASAEENREREARGRPNQRREQVDGRNREPDATDDRVSEGERQNLCAAAQATVARDADTRCRM